MCNIACAILINYPAYVSGILYLISRVAYWAYMQGSIYIYIYIYRGSYPMYTVYHGCFVPFFVTNYLCNHSRQIIMCPWVNAIRALHLFHLRA